MAEGDASGRAQVLRPRAGPDHDRAAPPTGSDDMNSAEITDDIGGLEENSPMDLLGTQELPEPHPFSTPRVRTGNQFDGSTLHIGSHCERRRFGRSIPMARRRTPFDAAPETPLRGLAVSTRSPSSRSRPREAAPSLARIGSGGERARRGATSVVDSDPVHAVTGLAGHDVDGVVTLVDRRVLEPVQGPHVVG